MHRRAFLRSAAVLGGGVALGVPLSAWMQRSEQGLAMTAPGFGPLVDMGDLALPEGFSYTVIGREGEVMTDGLPTAGAFDGMGAGERVVTVRRARPFLYGLTL